MSDTTSRLFPPLCVIHLSPRLESSWPPSREHSGFGVMDDCGASLLHIPLKSKQGTLYTRNSRENKRERKKGRSKEEKTEEEKGEGCRSKLGSCWTRRYYNLVDAQEEKEECKKEIGDLLCNWTWSQYMSDNKIPRMAISSSDGHFWKSNNSNSKQDVPTGNLRPKTVQLSSELVISCCTNIQWKLKISLPVPLAFNWTRVMKENGLNEFWCRIGFHWICSQKKMHSPVSFYRKTSFARSTRNCAKWASIRTERKRNLFYIWFTEHILGRLWIMAIASRCLREAVKQKSPRGSTNTMAV